MRFTIAVHGPAASDSQQSALAFAASVLDAGHRLNRVFFYHEGVLAASKPAGEPAPDLAAKWQALARDHDFELAVCVGAATRRSLLDEQDPTDTHLIHAGFEVVGLGQLIEAIAASDRFVTFAA